MNGYVYAHAGSLSWAAVVLAVLCYCMALWVQASGSRQGDDKAMLWIGTGSLLVVAWFALVIMWLDRIASI